MSCPICNDTGWKYIGPEHERRVSRCECRDANRADRLLKLASIPRRYENCELSEFVIRINGRENPSLAAARLAAERFVAEYPVEKHGLLFIGPVGVGKTHLAVSILRELVRQKSVRCLFTDYRELLRTIQDSYNPTVQATEMQVLRPVMEAEVLVLDELGAVKPSAWVWDTVSLILNNRYREELTTIITTNFPDLAERSTADNNPRSKSAAERAGSEPTLGDRITNAMRSRLHEMCRVVNIQGEDFRTHIKSASFHV